MPSNNDLVLNGTTITSTDQVAELQNFLDESQDERILRTDAGKAEILVTQNNVLISNETNYINVNQFGTTIDGKVHLASSISDIRINGFWTLNEELLTTLPSTIYTPIPVLVYNESPAVKEVQNMIKFLQGLG